MISTQLPEHGLEEIVYRNGAPVAPARLPLERTEGVLYLAKGGMNEPDAGEVARGVQPFQMRARHARMAARGFTECEQADSRGR